MNSTIIRFAKDPRANAHIYRGLQAALAIASLALGGCAIEGDEACGAHQVYKTGGEILEYAVCVCDETQNYVFDETKGYGCKPCPDDQTAVGGKCVAPEPDGGQDQADAGGGDGDSAPTGIGEYCESEADCASFDAKYCAVQMNMCMLNNCATGENTCTTGSVCCDFSKFLAGFSLCVPDEQLSDGACPMGGMKVEQ